MQITAIRRRFGNDDPKPRDDVPEPEGQQQDAARERERCVRHEPLTECGYPQTGQQHDGAIRLIPLQKRRDEFRMVIVSDTVVRDQCVEMRDDGDSTLTVDEVEYVSAKP